MKKIKNLSMLAEFKIDEDFNDDRFAKIRIRLQHDQTNRNGSSFNIKDIKRAKSSLHKIPILANTVFNKETGKPELGSHDMHLEMDKLNDGDLKLIYDEIPVGVIDGNDLDYQVESFMGKNHVLINGWLYKDYSNYVFDIVKSKPSTPISMEIDINKYEYDIENDVFKITDFKYLGITLLNENAMTGMEHANATLLESQSKCSKFSKEENAGKLNFIFDELQSILNKNTKKGFNNMKKTETDLLNKYNVREEDLSFNPEEFDFDELEAKLAELQLPSQKQTQKQTQKQASFDDAEVTEKFKFSSGDVKRSFNNNNAKTKAIIRELDSLSKKTRAYNAERDITECSIYWLCGFDENYVRVIKHYYGTEYRMEPMEIAYSYNTVDQKVRIKEDDCQVMVNLWMTPSEYEAEQEEKRRLQENYNVVVAKFNNYKQTHKISNDEIEEIEELRKYKRETEISKFNESKVKLFEQFSELEGDDEFEAFKDNTGNLTLDEIEMQCFIMLGKRNKKGDYEPVSRATVMETKKEIFSQMNMIPVLSNTNKQEKKSKYGDLFEKFLNK